MREGEEGRGGGEEGKGRRERRGGGKGRSGREGGRKGRGGREEGGKKGKGEKGRRDEVLFVAKPASHSWAEKESKYLWQQGNQCFPVLGVSIIHQGGLVLARPLSGGHEGGCAANLFFVGIKVDIVRWMTQSIIEMET